ncbi:MAG: hypothetical protein F4Y87_07605 [Synechococcus sp. SB0665_bin_28]|nr:hypothetical protein [Synechococcus sp. SB0665_bin_28]
MLTSGFLLVSCAKPPYEIEAIDVSDNSIYKESDCDTLNILRREETDYLYDLREKQIVRRQNDSARWMWLGVIGGIANATTEDFEEEIGKSKVKLITINKEISERCTLDKEEEEKYQEEISQFFFNHSDSEIDKLLADAARFYFEEP